MRRFLLAAALLIPVAAHAQVSPSRWTQNYIPTLTDWKAALLFNGQSFSEALSGFNALINGKISSQGGSGDSNKLTNAIVSAQALSSPSGSFNAPQSGGSLGIGAQTYISPNPKVQGSITVSGVSPIIHLLSPLTYQPFDIWQAIGGNPSFSTNLSGAMFEFYTSNGAFEFHDYGSGGAAKINLYGHGNSLPASIWQDEGGGLYLSPGSTNGSTSIYANGTGGIALYSTHIQLHGTNGSILDFYGHGQTTPSSIWQDDSGNMYIASQVANSNLYLEAAGSGSVYIPSPIKNTAMPTSSPGTGAHFVCVDDAGDMYRSDSACK